MQNGSKPTAAFELVTPKQAQRWLGQNDSNRHLRTKLVERYARDIEEGRWTYNPDGIAIREDGELQNGQHRLSAIVQAGSPAWLLIVRGMPRPAEINIDTGAKRMFGDFLQMERGEQHGAVLAAIVSFVWRWRQQPSLATGSGKLTPTAAELIATFDAGSDIFRDAAERVAKQWRLAPIAPSIQGGLFCVFSSIDYDDAVEFFDRFATGADVSKGDPALVLRNQLFNAKARSRAAPPKMASAWTVHAWNVFRRGDTSVILRYRPEEPFPEPK